MGVPPNHQLQKLIFHESSSYWGTTIYGTPHVYDRRGFPGPAAAAAGSRGRGLPGDSPSASAAGPAETRRDPQGGGVLWIEL